MYVTDVEHMLQQTRNSEMVKDCLQELGKAIARSYYFSTITILSLHVLVFEK